MDGRPDRFCALLTIRDDHHRGVAPILAERLAAHAGVPLTVFDATSDTARPGTRRTGVVALDPRGVGSRVAADVRGRDGALLVLDAHGGGAAGEALLDVDVEHVLTRVRHPVLVVGPQAAVPDGPWALVVPVDATGAERASCRVAARWLRTFSPGRIVLVALDVADTWPDDGTEPRTDPAGDALAALHQEGASATVIRCPTTDATATVLDVAHVTPSAVIVAAGDASHRTSHWSATVRRLVRRAPCPVLVVPDDLA
jgi:hypothetical protein